MAAARAAVERAEASERAEEALAETQRAVISAERYAARTRDEMQGQSIVEFLRHLGVQPGEEPYDSWIQRGGFSSEPILEHIQSNRELTQSGLELFINY